MTAAAMLPGLSQGCMSAAAMQYERAERGSQADLEVVGEAADGRAMVRLAREQPADVMVMDVRMPELDGVAATREIC